MAPANARVVPETLTQEEHGLSCDAAPQKAVPHRRQLAALVVRHVLSGVVFEAVACVLFRSLALRDGLVELHCTPWSDPGAYTMLVAASGPELEAARGSGFPCAASPAMQHAHVLARTRAWVSASLHRLLQGPRHADWSNQASLAVPLAFLVMTLVESCVFFAARSASANRRRLFTALQATPSLFFVSVSLVHGPLALFNTLCSRAPSLFARLVWAAPGSFLWPAGLAMLLKAPFLSLLTPQNSSKVFCVDAAATILQAVARTLELVYLARMGWPLPTSLSVLVCKAWLGYGATLVALATLDGVLSLRLDRVVIILLGWARRRSLLPSRTLHQSPSAQQCAELQAEPQSRDYTEPAALHGATTAAGASTSSAAGTSRLDAATQSRRPDQVAGEASDVLGATALPASGAGGLPRGGAAMGFSSNSSVHGGGPLREAPRVRVRRACVTLHLPGVDEGQLPPDWRERIEAHLRARTSGVHVYSAAVWQHAA